MTDPLTTELGAIAMEHGASGFGVADVAPFERERRALENRKVSGRSGPLRFTFDDPGAATDITRSFPWAKRLVVVGWAYLPTAEDPSDRGAVVGRFATSDQYRGVRRITSALATRLQALGFRAETLTDDNRLVDRAAAVRAGIGWWGRSTMVLTPGHGPWTLLGSVVTDAPLESSEPMTRSCGTCVACMPACPTGAIDGDGVDARRCLSTWLQTPASIPQWIRPHLGRRIYGCDECLVSCPPGGPALARTVSRSDELPFAELLDMSDDELLAEFAWWYVPRREGRFLRRNLLVAAGNSGEPSALPAIDAHLSHPSSMIKGHAAWAMARGFPTVAAEVLPEALDAEGVQEARDELVLAILMATRPRLHAEVLTADEKAHMDPGTRGLALLLDAADPRRVSEAEVVAVGADGWSDARLPMVNVYDPDRILDRERRRLMSVATPLR